MIADTIEIYMGFSPTVRVFKIYISYPKICIFVFIILLIMGYVNRNGAVV
jgi:hypothetical protein|tara:strand:- start:32605 stop:32754 length:150 start_codon:yes stop_codon:yes gene_type:complete